MKLLNRLHFLFFRVYRRLNFYFCKSQLIYSPSYGKKLEIHGAFEVIHPENFTYGDFLSINGGVYINAGAMITLGDNVSLSAKCMLITKGLLPDSMNEHFSEAITIGSNVQIGAGAIILPGVNIVDGVLIGAGSVVAKDIEVPGIYVGAPAKRISCL